MHTFSRGVNHLQKVSLRRVTAKDCWLLNLRRRLSQASDPVHSELILVLAVVDAKADIGFVPLEALFLFDLLYQRVKLASLPGLGCGYEGMSSSTASLIMSESAFSSDIS